MHLLFENLLSSSILKNSYCFFYYFDPQQCMWMTWSFDFLWEISSRIFSSQVETPGQRAEIF